MKFITEIVLLLSLTYVSTFDQNMITFIQKCTSKYNNKYGNISIGCRPLNRTSKLVSVDGYFHVPLEAPIYMELNAYKKFTTVYRPFMIKIKEELCAHLLQRDHIFYQIIPKSHLAAAGNLLDPCPIVGHRHVSPRVSTDATFILPLMPVGEWRFDLVMTKNTNGTDEFIGSVSMFYEIKPRGAEEF